MCSAKAFACKIAPDRQLEIVLSVKGGTVRGVVRDSNRTAAGGITVALVPDETRRQRHDLYRSAATDAAGRYEFRGIPPGNYKVFAWEDIEPKSWMEPAYLRVFEDLGKVVAAADGSSETADVLAISPLGAIIQGDYPRTSSRCVGFYAVSRGVASLHPWLMSVQPFGLRTLHAVGVQEISPE